MKKYINVLTVAYTSKQYGELDITSMGSKAIYRYRQDIFPNPDEFNVKIDSISPTLVSTGDQIYPYRLSMKIFFDGKTKPEAIARYKAAIERKVRRYDIVKSPSPKKPNQVVEPRQEPVFQAPAEVVEETTKPKETETAQTETSTAKPKTKRRRKKS